MRKFFLILLLGGFVSLLVWACNYQVSSIYIIFAFLTMFIGGGGGIVCLMYDKGSGNNKIAIGIAIAIVVILFIIGMVTHSEKQYVSPYSSYSSSNKSSSYSAADYIQEQDPELWSYMQGRWDALGGN